MKKNSRAAALIIACAVGLIAFAAWAAPRLLNTNSYHIELTACDGGVNATVPYGNYIVAIHNDGVYLCIDDAGCATGGQFLPQNLTMQMQIGVSSFISTTGSVISCRSDTSSGDISMTPVAPGT